MGKKFINKILGAAMLMALPLNVSAQNEWTTILYEDFGGNEVTDDLNGSPLPAGCVDPGLLFIEDGESYASDYGIIKYCTHDRWHTGGDHTHMEDRERGRFMWVNPDDIQKNVKVYTFELLNICPGVKFRFTAWFANMMLNTETGQNPALSLGIYKDKEGEQLVDPSAFRKLEVPKCSAANPQALDWEQLELEFSLSGNQNYAYFIVSVLEPQGNGFDFAIDDIRVEVNKPSVKIANVEEFEYGENIHLKASFDNNNFFATNNIGYRWYFSPDSTTFTQVGTTNPYTITSFDKDVHNGYYIVKIAEGNNFDSKVCALEGSFPIHETKNKKNVHLCNDEVKTLNGTTLDAKLLVDGQEVEGANDYTYVVSIMTPTPKQVEDDYVCVGMPYAGNGKTYDSEQVVEINDTIKSKVYGCDSIIIYKNLVVTGPIEKTLRDKYICQGSSYNNKIYNEVGTFPVRTSDGCIDYIQQVIVLPSYTDKTQIVNIREGGEFNGKTYPTFGTYTDVLRLQTEPVGDCQCDSIVKVTINVNEKIIVNLPDETICEGDVFTFGNTTYSAPGTYNLSVTTDSKVLDCDSVTNLKLVINPRYSNENKPRDTTICYGSQLFGKVYNEPTVEPIRIKTEHKSVVTGCDSIVYYDVNVLKLQLSLAVKADRNTVCRGEEIEIKVTNLEPKNTPLDWPLGLVGSSQGSIFTPEKDMVCVVKAARTVSTTETCETTDTVYVYVRDSPILTIDSVDQRENIVTYNVEGGSLPYKIMLDNKEVSTDASGELRDSYIGMHTLTAVDSNQCASSQRYSIVPVPITPSGYLSPNGDGVNDRWTIENIDVYSHARVRIYDRNGRMLMEYDGYDNEQGWDGRYNGHLMPATDYWYEINLPEIDDQYVGHFTLLYMQ